MTRKKKKSKSATSEALSEMVSKRNFIVKYDENGKPSVSTADDAAVTAFMARQQARLFKDAMVIYKSEGTPVALDYIIDPVTFEKKRVFKVDVGDHAIKMKAKEEEYAKSKNMCKIETLPKLKFCWDYSGGHSLGGCSA